MNVYIDRQQLKNPEVLGPYADQPTLIAMTEKALDVLSASERGKDNGFFLMVEGASIDKQLHPMDWERAAGDTIEMDQAIGAALDYARAHTGTLVVVTADHAHSVSVFGTYDATKGPGIRNAVGVYNEAKFPTYTDEDKDGFPDKWDTDRVLAVGFGNHPDLRDDFIFNPRPIEPTIRDPNFTRDTRYVPNPEKDPAGVVQDGNLPFAVNNETHSVDDVPLFAQGPGARNFHGIHDNTEIFLGMMAALGIDATANSQ
jgi:alkaline phosphatase